MARVVVIGSGIVGASTAFQLVQDGHEVVVVDPGVDGAATLAGAGIITAITAQHRSPETAAFAFAAVRRYADLIARLEELGYPDHDFGTVGGLIAATDEPEASALSEMAERARGLADHHGTPGTGEPELLDAATARRRCPILGPVTGALWLPSVARVDGRRLRACLLDAVRAQGGELIPEPASLRVRHGRVCGVTTPSREVGADVVVLAAGAWCAEIGRAAGLHLPVYPQRGQIVHVSLPQYPDLPVVTGFHSHYILSFPGGRIVFGATREEGAGFDYALTVGGIAETFAEATRIAPVLAEARWLEARIGFRPASPDGLPLLGMSRRLENLAIATGFGSQGLTLGPYAGSLLARRAVGESVALPDSFHPDRFAG